MLTNKHIYIYIYVKIQTQKERGAKMDLKQNVNNLIKGIETNTNLIILIYEDKNMYCVEIMNENGDNLKKIYDDLLGHYKYLKGIYETIKMFQFKDLEVSNVI